MRIFIAKLFVLVILISSFCFPSDQHAAENITNGQIVLTSSVTPAEQLPVNPQSKDSSDLPRLYLLEFLFGSFLLFIGLATIVLSLFRWKADDLSLIFFGVFCFVYGARSGIMRIGLSPIWFPFPPGCLLSSFLAKAGNPLFGDCGRSRLPFQSSPLR